MPEENLLLDFVEQGKITEAGTLTIRMGAALSGPTSYPPSSSPIFTPGALPAATLPLYPGLGQASNTLGCIPSSLVQPSGVLLIAITQNHPLASSVRHTPLNSWKRRWSLYTCSVTPVCYQGWDPRRLSSTYRTVFEGKNRGLGLGVEEVRPWPWPRRGLALTLTSKTTTGRGLTDAVFEPIPSVYTTTSDVIYPRLKCRVASITSLTPCHTRC